MPTMKDCQRHLQLTSHFYTAKTITLPRKRTEIGQSGNAKIEARATLASAHFFMQSLIVHAALTYLSTKIFEPSI